MAHTTSLQSVHAYTLLPSRVPPYHEHTSPPRDHTRTISACLHEPFSCDIPDHHLLIHKKVFLPFTRKQRIIVWSGVRRGQQVITAKRSSQSSNPRHNLERLPSAQGEKIHTASAQKLTRVIQYGGLVRR